MSQEQAISFPQAIQATQSLMEKMNSQQLDEITIEKEISSIVNTKNGGRGFFVAYLTSEMPLADKPSLGVINGLKSSMDVVGELLVKNLAMSSAMTITHSRNQDLDNIEGSRRVCQRTGNLIQIIAQDSINQELEKLKNTIADGEGEYSDFFKRWGYDSEHQQAIKEAITGVLS